MKIEGALEYIKNDLEARMQRLNNNLENDEFSTFQKEKFRKLLSIYEKQHTEICEVLNKSDE